MASALAKQYWKVRQVAVLLGRDSHVLTDGSNTDPIPTETGS